MSNICWRWFIIQESLNCLPMFWHTIDNFLIICCSKSQVKKIILLKSNSAKLLSTVTYTKQDASCIHRHGIICAFWKFYSTVFLWISTFHKCLICISTCEHRKCHCCCVNFYLLFRTIHPFRVIKKKKKSRWRLPELCAQCWHNTLIFYRGSKEFFGTHLHNFSMGF